LFEELEVWTARDVTFVLPDCYVAVTWEQRKRVSPSRSLALTPTRLRNLYLDRNLALTTAERVGWSSKSWASSEDRLRQCRRRASANAPRACGGLLLGLVSNRAVNLFGVLVTRGFG
jgi:hypothetical protein